MQDNYPDDTQKITRILSQFKPVPSESFYSRMSRAPWNKRLASARLALHISAAAVILIFLVYVIPASPLFVAPPHTPTNTQIAAATLTQARLSETTLTLISTPQPSATPNP